VPYNSVRDFAKAGAVNAMAKTDNTDIISADGVGMSAPVRGRLTGAYYRRDAEFAHYNRVVRHHSTYFHH
jgi:hypothetical protein